MTSHSEIKCYGGARDGGKSIAGHVHTHKPRFAGDREGDEWEVVNLKAPPISFVLSGLLVRDWPTSTFLRAYVNTQLCIYGARGRGTVHSWRYHDGSVRFTFQPEEQK